MRVSETGSETDLRFAQFEKALSPICVTLSGMFTEISSPQSMNARSSIALTTDGIFNAVTDLSLTPVTVKPLPEMR